MLKVNCIQCNATSTFAWNFNDYVTVTSSKCKECSDGFQLIVPTIGHDNIILNEYQLPPPPPHSSGEYYDGFYYNGNEEDFFYYHYRLVNIEFPIFYLNKTVSYNTRSNPKFSIDEYGLVPFSDIEEFITNYDVNKYIC